MSDFFKIDTRPGKRGVTEIYPKFIVGKPNDLMIRGSDFYAIWMEERGLWSTDEQDVIRTIDRELRTYADEYQKTHDNGFHVLYMWDAESGIIDNWHKYCQRQMRDNFHPLDEVLIFSNTPVKKESYASKRLPYPLEPGNISAYDELMGVLYSPEEREKLEWAIGAVVNGASKEVQKFIVLYGDPGSGKSTVLNIVQKLFEGYCGVFDSRALGSSSNAFALEAFKSNPLVSIQHDGDLSRIEDNTRLNSLVSHETMLVNEKFKSQYPTRFNCFLFLGTNKAVKITDAKSGLIRRLIDVTPTGDKLPVKRYLDLVNKVNFELGGIAWHCKEVYEANPRQYDDYIPTRMLGASNDFYNFMLDSFYIFKKEDGVSLKRAWAMYKDYNTETNVQYPYSRRAFREELMNYFSDYKEREADVNGERVRSYYSGFKVDKFPEFADPKPAEEGISEPPASSWIEFKEQHSLLDDICAGCPAQYANENGTPTDKWEDVHTTLSDLDTSRLHYVRVPQEHIVIDFDIPGPDGKKCFEKNLKAASKWPRTYAELSKSGAGIHLHYIYTGDVAKLSRIYDENIEVKVFTGKSSLRRKLSKCNDISVASISSGLPLKGEKMVDAKQVQNERHLRILIKKALAKEISPYTKPNVDFIAHVMEEAYEGKKNLLDLQQAKFENTYKAAIERYESDDKLAQTEYQLWTDTYEKTASVTEKSNKNIETINKRLAIQSEKTALAEKAWVETKDALGEASLVTQQAYRDYLEARQEQLELENELDKAQLAAFDDLSSFYDSRISMVQKRMNLLDKLYNDGDLSGREDAYASAVEQYGKDSIEARRAATQGTMTALMGVNSALTSMRWQLSKVTAMQQRYQTALEQAGGNRYDETVMAAYEDMMETRSTFADYVGNLADAFNVSDATKKAMMQFGDAIAQNWKPIQNGFMAVAKKMNPKLVQGFSDLFGLYMKDGASETVAAATNTVVAAMSGDWASALASGLTAVLDVVGTDFGQTLTEAISTALKKAFSGNGLFAQLLTKLFGSIDLGGSGSSGNLLSNIWQWLKGGASAAKSFLGGASKAAAGASGAAKIIPVLNSVGTATTNVASGVTTVAKAAGVATSGVLAKVGMGVAKVASGLGPHGLLAAAVIAGTVAVGTAVVKNWDKVKEAVGNAWSWIKEKASGLWDGMKSIGGNLMSGLATGVKSAAKFCLKVALAPAYGIISGFKHILGIHSPSKVMAGIGEYVVEGLTRGIVSTEGEAEKGMDEVGGAVIRSALATTNAIADHLSTDNHPSITPVVDLSDASRSSAWLNSAFADRKGTISMAATVTGRMARRAETPSRNQNGYETAPALTQSNRDVVEAVKTLGERIDRVAESVKGMKVVMNGRKFVGEIRSDIDDVVGDIIEKGH